MQFSVKMLKYLIQIRKKDKKSNWFIIKISKPYNFSSIISLAFSSDSSRNAGSSGVKSSLKNRPCSIVNFSNILYILFFSAEFEMMKRITRPFLRAIPQFS